MTADEFLLALHRIGATQVALAERLQINDRTVRRWASGSYPVPPTVAALLNLMVKARVKLPDLKI